MTTLTSRSPFREHRKLALAGFLAACYLVAAVSTVFSTPSIPGWYARLEKPAFNPPNQVFGPVWTVLYALMAVAAWMVWKTPDSSRRRAALVLFWIQLALNFAWSIVFFQKHLLGAAFGEILLLWVAVLSATILFFQVRKAAAGLFAPYLAWITFASLLNFLIWQKN